MIRVIEGNEITLSDISQELKKCFSLRSILSVLRNQWQRQTRQPRPGVLFWLSCFPAGQIHSSKPPVSYAESGNCSRFLPILWWGSIADTQGPPACLSCSWVGNGAGRLRPSSGLSLMLWMSAPGAASNQGGRNWTMNAPAGWSLGQMILGGIHIFSGGLRGIQPSVVTSITHLTLTFLPFPFSFSPLSSLSSWDHLPK